MKHPKKLAVFILLSLFFLSIPLPASSAEKVNINTASAEQLATLPGIGAAIAERIVAYREANGGFKTLDELMNVKGIGEGKFQKLKDLITVTG